MSSLLEEEGRGLSWDWWDGAIGDFCLVNTCCSKGDTQAGEHRLADEGLGMMEGSTKGCFSLLGSQQSAGSWSFTAFYPKGLMSAYVREL